MFSKYVAPDKLMASAGAIEQLEGGSKMDCGFGLAQKRNLKIACVVMGEMEEHFNSMIDVATALQERGHEVYIITNGLDAIRQKSKDHAEKLGVNMVYTNYEMTIEDKSRKLKGLEDPGSTFLSEWHPYVLDEVKKLGPDVIVSDSSSCFGCTEDLGIPVIINAPTPFCYMEQQGFDVPNMRKASSCCGMICMKQTFSRFYTGVISQSKSKSKSRYDHIWMFHSFFGLEKPVCLPPNVKLIGSIFNESSNMIKSLKEKDMNLYNWLEDALAKEEDVVFITFGSTARWQAWSINAVYRGLKNVGCRVVWSLQDEWYPLLEESPKDNPKFWMGNALPRTEILNHPAVKGGLSHCGWDSVQEFIGAGVPIVTFPHSAAQNSSSELITGQQAGVELPNQRRSNFFDSDAMTTYKEPAFDHTKVESCFNKILKDPMYAQNMQRLQSLARLTDGRKKVVETVEQAYYLGSDHLLDRALKKRMVGQSWCKATLFVLLLLCMLASCLYFGSQYYYPVKYDL